jgi:hypothetical protein
MQLWQMDIVGGVMLADGSECKVVTGVEDHSRFCVIAAVVVRATGRAVCAAFAGALVEYGVPEEVLTDNGKQFTGRFGRQRGGARGAGGPGGEVLFDRICRKNGITHRLTAIRSPTTARKVERLHLTLRRELLDGHELFADLAAAQAALDRWRVDYNTARPHQSLEMSTPASRFVPAIDNRLELRLPAGLTSVAGAGCEAAVPEAAPRGWCSGGGTALRLVRAAHEIEVWSRDPVGDTTSAVAAALWYPYRALPEEPVTGGRRRRTTCSRCCRY